MPITQDQLETLIQEAFPDAEIDIQDLAGDGDHYAAHIKSKQFEGMTRVKQHQMVYAALKGKMGDDLHALAIQTSTPES